MIIVALVRTLLQEPQVLILNDICTTMTPVQINQLAKLLTHLSKNKIIFINSSNKTLSSMANLTIGDVCFKALTPEEEHA